MNECIDTSPISEKRKLANVIDKAGILVVFIFLFILLAIFIENFFSIPNLIGLSLSVSMVGMLACTMLFCLASGDFDLSIGAVIAFSGVLTAVMINRTGSVAIGVACGILVGGLVGFFNGFVISKLHITALITTLSTMQIVRGLGYITSNGSAVGIQNDKFYGLGTGNILGIPNPIWITVICFMIFGILLNKTTFGRNTLVIGGNKDAAKLSGINVDKIKIMIFTIQGLMGGLAGVSLTGGIGSMLGCLVGVLIMGTVQNALNLMNVPTFYQYLVRGIILLLAVLFDQLKQRKSE